MTGYRLVKTIFLLAVNGADKGSRTINLITGHTIRTTDLAPASIWIKKTLKKSIERFSVFNLICSFFPPGTFHRETQVFSTCECFFLYFIEMARFECLVLKKCLVTFNTTFEFWSSSSNLTINWCFWVLTAGFLGLSSFIAMLELAGVTHGGRLVWGAVIWVTFSLNSWSNHRHHWSSSSSTLLKQKGWNGLLKIDSLNIS